jgi:hypothetical protein
MREFLETSENAPEYPQTRIADVLCYLLLEVRMLREALLDQNRNNNNKGGARPASGGRKKKDAR